MKTLVIYSSQTGFTEKYAKWLSQDLDAECISLKNGKHIFLSDYDSIIYGGWCCAGSINGLNRFISKLLKEKSKITNSNKKIGIFGVGGSPLENPEIAPAFEKINSDINNKLSDTKINLKLCYFPGGFNYDKMNTPSKIAMKLFVKMLEANKNKTEQDEMMIKMISSSYDISDKKYLEPLLNFLR